MSQIQKKTAGFYFLFWHMKTNDSKDFKKKLKLYMQTILEVNHGQNCRQAFCSKVSITTSTLFKLNKNFCKYCN